MSIKFYQNLSLLLIFLSTSIIVQAQKTKVPKKITVTLELTKDSCGLDTLRFYAWTGLQVEEVDKATLMANKAGNFFEFVLEDLQPGNYYLGKDLQNMRPIIVGKESKMVFEGDCDNLQAIKVKKSAINTEFNSMLDSIRNQNTQFFNLLSLYKQNLNKPEVLKELDQSLANMDFRKKAILNRLKKEHPQLAKISALYTYLSYQNNKENDQQQEGDYLGKTYFQFADLSDPEYQRIPFFFEAVKGYAQNMTKVGLPDTKVESYLDELLKKVGEDQPHYRSAVLGVAFGIMPANKSELFMKYAKAYQDKYEGENPILDKFLAQQIIRIRGAAPVGEEAPNFSAQTPEGKTVELKDFRGKVLLVDFWASWCGPCRRENPNVVRVYNKYKDKGFDILGVSLDKSKDRWVGAIQQDQLTWTHISDLKGWQSEPAQLYQVRGIPFTMLLDKDGKVIAKNLRGPALEAKLKEVLGE